MNVWWLGEHWLHSCNLSSFLFWCVLIMLCMDPILLILFRHLSLAVMLLRYLSLAGCDMVLVVCCWGIFLAWQDVGNLDSLLLRYLLNFVGRWVVLVVLELDPQSSPFHSQLVLLDVCLKGLPVTEPSLGSGRPRWGNAWLFWRMIRMLDPLSKCYETHSGGNQAQGFQNIKVFFSKPFKQVKETFCPDDSFCRKKTRHGFAE